jgi:hypothetical protein
LRKRAGRGSNEENRHTGKKAVEFYAALVLALTLAAIAAVLYFYAMFMEARTRQQKTYIAGLERANAELRRELRQTRALLDRELEHSRALWPDILDDAGDLSRN